MDDFNQINEIVAESIKSSSYVTVLISSGVYIIYTLIIKVVDYFKSKDKNKPILQMATAIKEVTENVVSLNSILRRSLEDAEVKELNKLKNVIALSFNSFNLIISNTCIDIIIHNNIDANHELIKENIFKTISTEYYKLYNVFSAYETNDVNVATKLKDEWIDEITKECLAIIYNGQETMSRIIQVNNKLSIICNEHSIYINNKVFNH